jgi:hypothetical protein
MSNHFVRNDCGGLGPKSGNVCLGNHQTSVVKRQVQGCVPGGVGCGRVGSAFSGNCGREMLDPETSVDPSGHEVEPELVLP